MILVGLAQLRVFCFCRGPREFQGCLIAGPGKWAESHHVANCIRQTIRIAHSGDFVARTDEGEHLCLVEWTTFMVGDFGENAFDFGDVACRGRS